ncbi:hypothetical protein [Nocardia sp. NPDC127526]|uniref:hypothetical protein n=1 Tax=Nocardia sp. NPDC127526 TaxID=3345393 RepID=UPI003628BC12
MITSTETETNSDTDTETRSGAGGSADRRTARAARRPARGRAVSIPISVAGWTAAGAALIAAVCVLAWLLIAARGELADRDAAAAAQQHAEQAATEYAVGASTIDYTDLDAWIAKLKAGTSGQLTTKFDATAPKLEDILVPLQWKSSATPVAAKVMSEDDGVYRVDVFLSVSSTSAQTPDGGQTTVTYNVTLDANDGWKITDVGGIDGAMPLK